VVLVDASDATVIITDAMLIMLFNSKAFNKQVLKYIKEIKIKV
jgi:hypothetical protein